MRIIAGKYKNRAIATPPGLITRPLLSRIRKSLFDILQPYLSGARVLDLFSGTGILALEALSRGAAYALSIEADFNALQTAKSNHEHICPQESYRLIRGDVLLILPKLAMSEKAFDIIGVTPPYGQGLVDAALKVLEQCPSLIHKETIFYTQRDAHEEIQLDWPYLEHVRTKEYGRTVFEFFLPKTE